MGFAAAARLLGRHPSVLSRHVAALEAWLGIRLLERSTRRVSATEAGARYYDKVREALRLMRDAENEARAMAKIPSGLLRLTLPTAFGRSWLAPTRRVLCASPAYLARSAPLRQPDDLQRADCLMFTPMASHPIWHLQQDSVKRAVRAAAPYASDDADALIAAALAGLGVMLAADWLVAGELKDGRLVEVLPDWRVQGKPGVFLLRASRQHASAKTRVFCDWASDLFSASPWWVGPK